MFLDILFHQLDTLIFIGNLIGNFDAEYLIVFNNLFISLGCIIWMKLFHYKPFYCMIITIFYFSEESFSIQVG